MGYLDDEENTQAKIDARGWLHTGDLGFMDPDEFLYVVGNTRGEQDKATRCSETASGRAPQGRRGQWCGLHTAQ